MAAAHTVSSAVHSVSLPSILAFNIFEPSAITPPASETSTAEPLLPSPEPSRQDLASQISSLRDELRNNRIGQAARCSQLKFQATEIDKMKAELEAAGRIHEELGLKLSQERNKAKAVAKKLDVAVANHASAVDKLMRVMPKLEELRRVKAQVENRQEREIQKHTRQFNELAAEKDANIQVSTRFLSSR